MSDYIQYLLFDADGTLLDFHASEQIALQATFDQYGYKLTPTIKESYLQINENLWRELELGTRSLDEIRKERFVRLFEQYAIAADPVRFDQIYMERLASRTELIPKAYEVCKALSQKFQLAIVTNGITKTPKGRLEKSGLHPFFSHIFVSEEIGFSKPDVRFFETVFLQLKIADKESAMIIGDSLSADIKGGKLFGLKTCWFNPAYHPNHSGISADYEISSLAQLLRFAQ